MRFRERASDLMMKSISALHRGILHASGGRLGGRLISMPAVELVTTGRVSGKRRSTMLTAPIHDDDRIVLVASKGGDDRHPEWYRNLIANPEVELVLGGSTLRMLARTASPEEKAAMWPEITRVYPGYAGYQRRTSRDIPVVICEPRP